MWPRGNETITFGLIGPNFQSLLGMAGSLKVHDSEDKIFFANVLQYKNVNIANFVLAVALAMNYA